jgi:pimeloyl-ACP methyl ester carboxylesterase
VKKVLVVCIALVVLSLALPAAAQDNVPRFESTSCAFTVPAGQTPECGFLVVPEDRANPTGSTIKIAVAVFRSTNPNKAAEPVIYLDGGPGGNTLATAGLQFQSLFAPFQDNHDIILFDQRGVGLSQPALNCDEETQFTYDTLDEQLTADQYVQRYADSLNACAKRFLGQSVDTSAYNSAESASDVNDLRSALGYDKLDLYGISYGTRLALTILRDHPEAVHSAIIDSVVPLQISYFGEAKNVERVFNTLFQGCAVDDACNAAYPNLETVFFNLVKQFDATPITVQLPDLNTGKQLPALIDGDSLIGTFFQAFYATDLIPAIPKAIYDIQNGDYNFITSIQTLQLLQLKFISTGMFMAVQCKEEVPFDTPDSINAVLQEIRPELRGFVRRQLVDPAFLQVCANWKEGAVNPIENEPVVSDIPTLVMSGEYDPVTPPAYGKLAAQTLSRSYFYEFPGTGHGVIVSNQCALSIAQAFLADPLTKPGSACLADVTGPNFEVPGMTVDAAPVTMVAFTNTTLGISGVVPEGWKEAIPGTYLRGKSGLDQTGLAYQVVPGGNVDLVLPLLSNQFGVTDTTGTTRFANGLQWRLVQGALAGYNVDMALADGVRGVYLILLTTNNDAERESLYEQVFLPAVDALIPA